MVRQYIGDRAFYRRVLALALPIMVQNGITNFVSMLDNVMVGQVGTVQMTGVAVANQLVFVFNLCIFGAVSGAGIFGAQYFGCGDQQGVRHTFRFKLMICVALTVLCGAVFLLWGDPLIGAYLRGEGNAADAAASLSYARNYLRVMLVGLIPYAIVQCYSSTLRESGQTVLPMVAGLVAVGVNLCFNYVLIFGKMGAPRLGVLGAAVATVISRFAELGIVAVWTRTHADRNPFILGAFRSLYVPAKLMQQIALKGLPLMLNETFWAAGMAMLNQCYSVRGLDVVAANNISATFFNVFSVAFLSVGTSIGIILGQLLGAGKAEEARESSRKLIAFSVFISVLVAVVYAVCAEFIPHIYNTEPDIRRTATRLMQISALAFPLDAFANASYFTLRSGGKIMVTILFDSCFVWAVQVPAALLLSRLTPLPILPLYAVCQLLSIVKCVLGYWLVKKGVWIRKIVSDTRTAAETA